MSRKQRKFLKHVTIGIGVVSLIILVIIFIFCMARIPANIPANTVGVKVSAFNGVSNKTMPTGWHLKMPFVDKVYKLPTSVQTKSLEKLTTQTKDGQWLNTNIDVKYRVEKAKAMTVFQEYTNLENVNNLLFPQLFNGQLNPLQENMTFTTSLEKNELKFMKKLMTS